MKRFILSLIMLTAGAALAQQKPDFQSSVAKQVQAYPSLKANKSLTLPSGTTPGFPAWVADTSKIGGLFVKTGGTHDQLGWYDHATGTWLYAASAADVPNPADFVHKTGSLAETVTGAKTFSDGVIGSSIATTLVSGNNINLSGTTISSSLGNSILFGSQALIITPGVHLDVKGYSVGNVFKVVDQGNGKGVEIDNDRIFTTDGKNYVTDADITAYGFHTGTGTSNYIAKWTGTTSQGNSLFFDNGTLAAVGYSSDPGSGNKFAVNGNAYFNGQLKTPGTGTFTAATGLSLFSGNDNYKIAFDAIDGTYGLIRFNVDYYDPSHGFVFSGGSASSPTTMFSILGGNGVFANTVSASGYYLGSTQIIENGTSSYTVFHPMGSGGFLFNNSANSAQTVKFDDSGNVIATGTMAAAGYKLGSSDIISTDVASNTVFRPISNAPIFWQSAGGLANNMILDNGGNLTLSHNLTINGTSQFNDDATFATNVFSPYVQVTGGSLVLNDPTNTSSGLVSFDGTKINFTKGLALGSGDITVSTYTNGVVLYDSTGHKARITLSGGVGTHSLQITDL